MRPLSVIFTVIDGNSSYVFDCMPWMRERLIGDLVTSLKQLGAAVGYLFGINYFSSPCSWKKRSS